MKVERINFSWWTRIKVFLFCFKNQYFSLHKFFRKNNAIATINFTGDSRYGNSIIIKIGKTSYYFEGKPIMETYKSLDDKEVTQKTLSYGGWEQEF